MGCIRDVDLNGKVDIRDAVTWGNHYLGNFGLLLPTGPDPPIISAPVSESGSNESSALFKIFDGNDDKELAVGDIVAIVKDILGLNTETIPKSIASGPAVIDLGTTITMDDGRLAIPVYLDAPWTMAGAFLTFTFDPTVLKVEVPVLPAGSGTIGFDSHITKDGTLRAILYSLSMAEGLATGRTPMLLIPVTFLGETDATVTLTDFGLANNQAQTYPVELGVVTQTFNKSPQIPMSFAL